MISLLLLLKNSNLFLAFMPKKTHIMLLFTLLPQAAVTLLQINSRSNNHEITIKFYTVFTKSHNIKRFPI